MKLHRCICNYKINIKEWQAKQMPINLWIMERIYYMFIYRFKKKTHELFEFCNPTLNDPPSIFPSILIGYFSLHSSGNNSTIIHARGYSQWIVFRSREEVHEQWVRGSNGVPVRKWWPRNHCQGRADDVPNDIWGKTTGIWQHMYVADSFF